MALVRSLSPVGWVERSGTQQMMSGKRKYLHYNNLLDKINAKPILYI